MGHVSAAFAQQQFRGRNDDGSETAASWIAAVNTNFSQLIGVGFRLRFAIAETAGGGNNNSTLQLQYNINGAGWNNVTGSSAVARAIASANLTDGQTTTQQISTGTFISPNDGVDEADGAAGGANADFVGNDKLEAEYSIQLVSGDVSDSDTIQFRVLVDGATITYTVTPTVTATAPTPPTVTTQAASSVGETTATGNGTITDIGGGNATVRGFCYVAGAGTPTTADSVVNESGSFGTGAFSLPITGLTASTLYSIRAYAINAGGTSYGSTVTVTTAAPNTPPTTVQDTADLATFSTVFPTLLMTATDADGDPVRYQIEITGGGSEPTYDFGREDLEGGDFTAFDSEVETGGLVNLDTTSKVAGVNSAQFVNTSASANVYLQKALAADQTELYVQIKGFLPSGFAFGANNYTGFLSIFDNSFVEAFRCNLENNAGVLVTVAGDAIGYRATGVRLPVNQVFTIQFRIVKNGTTGRVQIWLDSSPEGSPDYDSGDINSGTVALRHVRFGKTFAPDVMSDYYLDDFVLYTGGFIGGAAVITRTSGTDLGFAAT